MTIRVKYLPIERRSDIYDSTIESFSAVDKVLGEDTMSLIITRIRFGITDIAYERSEAMKCAFFPSSWSNII